MKKQTLFISAILISFILLTSYGCAAQITETKTTTNNVTIEWATIPAGTFTMGSPATEIDRGNNEAQHTVTLSCFKMSRHQIVNRNYV
jgi:formylglycine-generating enzyme required for sulfatase activity